MVYVWYPLCTFKVYCYNSGLAEAEPRSFGEELGKVDRFRYLSSRMSPSGCKPDDVSVCAQKARSTFIDLKHLWHRRDSQLSAIGIIYIR